MKLLLDSHVLLWFFEDPARLKKSTIQLIEDAENEICISTAVISELMIKISKEKLMLEFDLEKVISENDIRYLPITAQHAYYLRELPWIHKDPFDRIQIAQSIIERIPFISGDARILQYDFSVLEA